MEKQKLIYVESKALFSPSSVSNKAIVFIKDTKEIWTHGTYFICSNVWTTPITLTLSGDSTGSVSIDGSGNVTLLVTNKYLDVGQGGNDANFTVSSTHKIRALSEFAPSFANGFPASNYANAIININTHSQNYDHQLGFSSNRGIYHRTRNAGNWETSWEKLLTSTNYTNFPHTFASLTNKPTTISGYGITDSIPIIKGGEVKGDTDLSTLGMTTTGYKFSISYGYTSQPSWLTAYTNLFIFRASSDFYSGIATALSGGHVTFLGGRNAETAPNNVPNWWFRIYGTSGLTYNLANIQTAINNLGSTYLPLTGGTLTDTLILKAGAFTASNSNSYSGGRYQAVSKPNIRLIGDSTYGLSTIEFTSLKGDTSINKPSDSGFIQFLPYGVSALSSVGSHPTLKTSGESNALVLGVTNDSDDIIVLLSPNVSGLRHACGATEYYLPHITTSTTSINRPLLSTTTAHVYLIGPSALGDAAYLPLSKFVYATSDTYYSYGTTEASGKSSTLNRTQFWRDNNRAMIGVYVQHSINANYGFELASSYGADSLEYRRKFNGAWETALKILTNTNYTTHLNNTYLPLSGGVMTGLILMTRGSSYLTDTGSTYSMLGMVNSGTTTVGMNSEEGMFINVPFTLATLRTSGNNLWHYNHANSARYLILDANNYTNYTIPYSKVNVTNGALGAFIHNGNLLYNNNFKYLTFFPSDNLGNVSYVLIAKIDNWANTANATSAISYGINGLFIAYRGGNMANTGSYFVTNVAYVDTNYKNYKLYVSETRNELLIPLLVIYLDEYYLAFKKVGSSTDYYFYGQIFNILSSFIYVNDASLITPVSGPFVTGTTSLYYYNEGKGFKKFLHEGNYSNYALPLTGGTLTGTLTSSNIVPRTSVTYDIGTTSTYYNNIYALYFKRKDSSDSYVLLGGGGHKLLSDFVLTSSLNNYVTLSTDLTVSGKKLFNNQLIIRKDVGDTDSNVIDIQHDLQLQVRRDSNTHSVAIGVMPTGAGVIWAKANGIGYNTLYLNPYNNGVAIGCGGNGALPNLNDGHYFHIFGSTLSNNSITATKFIKSGGTSSQFLKADGSLDNNAYLPLSGGTMTGALNFKNNTWNKVGDDAYMGDCDVAGMIGIKGSNAATPGFAMYNNSGTLLGKLYANSTSLYWSNAKILTASGTSTLFVMGDGSLYSDTVSYTTWDKTTTSGIAWFPIARIINPDLGSALFIVRAYAHSSIIFTVTSGHDNGNINVLAGGGSFNAGFAYIMGVRLMGDFVELGLNAAATSVNIVVKVLLPTFTHCLKSSLVESTSTTTPYAQYELNTKGNNFNFGIVSSKFTGNLIGNADTASKWVTARTITLTGDVTGSVSLDGSSNVTLNTATSGTAATTFLKCIDKRNSYPALIVTSGGTIGASFMTASKLGISGDGSYYDALIIRGYGDHTGGNENAIMFGKNTSSVYHSLYAFGSTTTWGTLYKFLDSGNYKNYAPSLSGEGATGTWGISISGTANKVANALTLLLNGGTTSGTNKFVYDGSSAYTVNITPASIGAAASSHTHSYLPLAGGTLGNTSATETELRLKSSTATLRLVAYLNTFNYIQSGNADFNGSTPLQITGYNGTVGSDLYLKFTNIYCRSGNYTNIDSGNYSSYALPLSGGTLTDTLISRDIRPSANLSYSLGTSSYYYNYVYANYFKKNGSSDSYVLLGGGGHKAVSDFAPNNVATLSSSGMGNSDLWTLVFEKSYPANYWYAPTTMFYIRSGTAGCGILCFYNYWASGTQLDDYEREVWFFGALKSETGITFGGANRDINDFFRIYIDKANFKYCIYYNRYNDLSLKILELLFFTVPEPGEYLSTGSLRSSFFTNSTTVVDLPTESSTLVRVPIKTTYNHDRTIKTTKSIYASSFYENSDIRLKENVRGIDLSDLTKLVDLVQFNFKDGGTKKYGVIAQLLELVGLQNLVYENNGNKAVDYISLLVLEIQRLRNEIGELKLEINKKN